MLASVQKILETRKVENADTLDVVKVLGWQVVAKSGEFKPGDYCVYVEIDTVLPADRPEFEFMRNKGFRVKTARLRGELSQGIVFPLSILLEGDWSESMDVSETLGITHYEKPIPLSMNGVIRGGLPFGIFKTDEDRVQNHPGAIEEFQGKNVYITTKIDGTSATFAIKNGDFHVCTRNNSYQKDVENVYWQMAEKYELETRLKGLGRNISLSGEIAGPGIQKNRLALKSRELFIFNGFNLDTHQYMGLEELIRVTDTLGLKRAPLEYTGVFGFTFGELMEMAGGYYCNTKNLKEGIVIRTVEEEYSKVMKGRSSFKVVSNEFLIRNKE